MVGDAVVVMRVADQNELAAPGQGVEQGVVDQMHALLLIQPPHVRDDGPVGLAQPEPVPKRILVLFFALYAVARVVDRQVRVGLGGPCVILDAVEDPRNLSCCSLRVPPSPQAPSS